MPIQKDHDPESEWRRTLEERIASLETALRAGNTSIDKGQLRVKPDTGSARVLTAGKAITDSSGTYDGFLAQRQDGNPAFRLARYDDGSSQASIHDAHGNKVLGDDRSTGYGLAAPNIPMPFTTNNILQYPSTVSSTFFPIQHSFFPQQHAGIYFLIQAYADAGTVVEFQVTYDYTNAYNRTIFYGPLQHVGNGATGEYFRTFLTVPDPSKYGIFVNIFLEIRRVSGAGTGYASFKSITGAPSQ